MITAPRPLFTLSLAWNAKHLSVLNAKATVGVARVV